MEKAIYAVWRSETTDQAAFNTNLRKDVAPQLASLSHAVRLNLRDDDIANGTSPKTTSTRPQMDAVIQLWVDSAEDRARAAIDELIGAAGQRFAAWLVCETAPIVNTTHIVAEGERLPGFSQIVFLGKPARLSWAAWREAWQVHHTQPAIDTQSNFEYLQNLIIRPLTYGAPEYAAIVEECFPIEALTDMSVYFDAEDDPAKMEKNIQKMMSSVERFIDHARMDCFPTSQYDVKKLMS